MQKLSTLKLESRMMGNYHVRFGKR